MTRYKILDELLSSRYHNYSLDDLTEEVSNRLADIDPDTNGVVRRTIEKDIYYLEYASPFMVDIERYSVPGYNKEKQKSYSKQCLRYSNPSFSIFKKSMTDDEEYLLSEALSLLGQFDGLPNLDALEGLRLGLGVKKEGRKIISFTKNPLEGSSILGELFTAISQRQVIAISYHRFNSPDDVHTINLYTYLLKEYNRRWFLLASAEQDNKLLNFGLDRIDAVETIPTKKYKECEQDIQECYDDIIGVTYYANHPIEHIVFWVSDTSKNHVLTKPLHESQKVYRNDREQLFRSKYPNLTNGAFFSIDVIPNYEMYRELMGFGKELLVLEPATIQDTIVQKLAENLQEYENTRT